ncbi:MAG: GxxExxY protein [Gemmatimonadales bacterium]|nr:GxxExxY protein [Gemmatimonadales bacterium]
MIHHRGTEGSSFRCTHDIVGAAKQQVALPVQYRGLSLDCGYRLDILVEQSVIIEVKALSKVLPVHRAQVLTYLKLTGLRLGLLINFNVDLLRHGVNRIING